MFKKKPRAKSVAPSSDSDDSPQKKPLKKKQKRPPEPPRTESSQERIRTTATKQEDKRKPRVAKLPARQDEGTTTDNDSASIEDVTESTKRGSSIKKSKTAQIPEPQNISSEKRSKKAIPETATPPIHHSIKRKKSRGSNKISRMKTQLKEFVHDFAMRLENLQWSSEGTSDGAEQQDETLSSDDNGNETEKKPTIKKSPKNAKLPSHDRVISHEEKKLKKTQTPTGKGGIAINKEKVISTSPTSLKVGAKHKTVEISSGGEETKVAEEKSNATEASVDDESESQEAIRPTESQTDPDEKRQSPDEDPSQDKKGKCDEDSDE